MVGIGLRPNVYDDAVVAPSCRSKQIVLLSSAQKSDGEYAVGNLLFNMLRPLCSTED